MDYLYTFCFYYMRFSAKVKRCTESLQSGPVCQRLPLWGSWREAPERARPLPENHNRNDSIALTEGLLIAARRLSGDGLALSVTFGATSPRGRGFRPRAGGMWSFVFLFVEKCVILVLRPCPPTSIGGEVSFMVHFLAILESVVADVISHYICKWLDRFDKDRKPD